MKSLKPLQLGTSTPTILIGTVETEHQGRFVQLSLHTNGSRPYHGNHMLKSIRIPYDIANTAKQMASFLRRPDNKPVFTILNGFTDEMGRHITPQKCDPCNIALLAMFTTCLYRDILQKH